MFLSSILELSKSLLKKYPLCDHCLGRQFARLSRGTSNLLRGFSIKLMLSMDAHMMLKRGVVDDAVALLDLLASNGGFEIAANLLGKLGYDKPEASSCYICGGLFESVDKYVEKALSILSEYEFSTFLVGSRIPGEIAEREDRLRAEFNLVFGESFKSEFNRFLGKRLQSILGKTVAFKSPDLVVLFDFVDGSVSVESKPMFIYGRYRKLIRGLPQTTWFCNKCWGRGCEACGFTGRRYPTSIEELISKPVLELTLGEMGVFHGAGREDVDALMLGDGRPFIFEVKDPKRRLMDLEALTKAVNDFAEGKIEVKFLRFSSKREVRRLKSLSPLSRKTYRALIRVDGNINPDLLSRLDVFFTDKEIRQRTPSRVMRRRADKVRVKHVYSVKSRVVNSSLFESIICCQGGLYIKELISGDVGRTEPNFSDFLGVKAECVELDVLKVSEAL